MAVHIIKKILGLTDSLAAAYVKVTQDDSPSSSL